MKSVKPTSNEYGENMMKVMHDSHTEAHKTTWEKENKIKDYIAWILVKYWYLAYAGNKVKKI